MMGTMIMDGAATMGQLIRLVRPHLPVRLVDQTTFSWMESVCDAYPPLSGLIIERPLGTPAGRADLALRMLAADRGRAFLAGQGDVPVPRHVPAMIGQLARGWADVQSPYRAVDVMWLEFDQPGASGSVPAAFFGLHGLGASHDWVIEGAALLAGKPLGTPVRKTFTRLLRALAPNNGLVFVGVMLSRSEPVIRLCANVSVQQACRLCDLMDVEQGGARINSATGVLGVALDTVVTLHVDIGETIGHRIGLELRAPARQGWAGTLAQLRAGGLCTAEEVEDLKAWQGHDSALHAFSPDDVTLAPAGHRSADTALQIRTLNHVKLVLLPGAPMSAKAYLYAGFVWPGPRHQAGS